MRPVLLLTLSTVITACRIAGDGRLEVRQLNERQRAKVFSVFNSVTRKLKVKTSMEWLCKLVESVDDRLKPMKFPYWDSSLEMRLKRPADSMIFAQDFFPMKKKRIRRQLLLFSAARHAIPKKLKTAIKSTPAYSSIFIAMHLLHLTSDLSPATNCSFCNGPNEFLFCSTEQLCVAKVFRGRCDSNQNTCSNSQCADGECFKDDVPKRKISRQATVSTVDVEGSGTAPIEPDRKDLYNLEYGPSLPDQLLMSPSTNTPLEMKNPNHNHQQEAKNETPFDVDLPFKTVYFTITVTKKNKRANRALPDPGGISVSTEGTNIPSGYTQRIKGEYDYATTRFIVRVPDPASNGALVSTLINVQNNGKPCRMLKIEKGPGKNSKRINISQYQRFSDINRWYNTPSEAIASLWLGTGYYRKIKNDPIKFVC